jgi:hypothetical protein
VAHKSAWCEDCGGQAHAQADTPPWEGRLHLGLKPRPHMTLQQLGSPLASLGAQGPSGIKGRVRSWGGGELAWERDVRHWDGEFRKVGFGRVQGPLILTARAGGKAAGPGSPLTRAPAPNHPPCDTHLALPLPCPYLKMGSVALCWLHRLSTQRGPP